MPTGFPRAIVYDPAMRHHITVVVRKDIGRIQYFCAECMADEDLPIELLEATKGFIQSLKEAQVVSWIEVEDHGN